MQTIRGFMGPPLEICSLVAYQLKLDWVSYPALSLLLQGCKAPEAQLFSPWTTWTSSTISSISQQPKYPTAVHMTANLGNRSFPLMGIYLWFKPLKQCIGTRQMSFVKLWQLITWLQKCGPYRSISFDMIEPKKLVLKKLAVTWGFGEEKDLMWANPDWIAHQPTDILQHLQLKTLNKRPQPKS